MAIWWNSREDFENSQAIIRNPERLPALMEDEKQLFASHANPICLVTCESGSPVGSSGVIYDWVPQERRA